MQNSPRTTVCGIVIALIILLVFVNWGELMTGSIPEIAKLIIAIFVGLLGFFAMDEGTH